MSFSNTCARTYYGSRRHHQQLSFIPLSSGTHWHFLYIAHHYAGSYSNFRPQTQHRKLNSNSGSQFNSCSVIFNESLNCRPSWVDLSSRVLSRDLGSRMGLDLDLELEMELKSGNWGRRSLHRLPKQSRNTRSKDVSLEMKSQRSE